MSGKSVVALEHVNKDNISKYGVASVEEGENGLKVKDLIEKPKAEDAPSDLAIASRYIFDSGIFDAIDKTEPGRNGEIQLTDAMRQISAKQNLLGHIISEKRHDIGSKIGFIKANIEFALKREDTKAEISDFIQNLEI